MESEQKELLDDLMTQLSQTQVDLAISMNIQHYKESVSIVKNHVIASMSMGLIPVALFDIAALSTNQQLMLQNLCRHYNVDYDGHRVKLLITSLVSGSLPVMLIMGLASITKLIPGVGTLGGTAGVVLLGSAVTYALGQTFIRHFTMGGTLENFAPEQFSDVFKNELNKGKEFAKQIDQEPIASS